MSTLILFLASIFLHELGHYVAAKAVGVPVKGFGLHWCGPFLVRQYAGGWRGVFISLSGITVNLALVFLTTGFIHNFNIAMVIINLFFPKSDGWNAVQALRRQEAV